MDPTSPPLTFEDLRDVALEFPGVEVGTSYGTPALRVRRRFIARMHQREPALVLRMDFETREEASGS